MSYKIQWEPKGVLLDYSGSVDIDDFDNAYVELMESNKFDELRYIINNFLDINAIEFDLDDIDKRVHFMKAMEKSNDSISFVTVSNNQDVLAFAGIIEVGLLESSWSCELFSSIGETREWIGKKHPGV